MKLNRYDMAKICLLVYALKYDWVKEKALEEGIDLSFGLSDECSKSEINDYIYTVKMSQLQNLIDVLYELFKKATDIDEKVEYAQQIVEAKQKMVKLYDNSN